MRKLENLGLNHYFSVMLNMVRTILFSLMFSLCGAFGQSFPPSDSSWFAVTRNGVRISDATADQSGNRNIVGDSSNPAAYVWSDTNYLAFRLRLDSSPLVSLINYQAFCWGVEICISTPIIDYQYICGVDGISDAVTLYQNTVQASPDDPSDSAETFVASYPLSSNSRVVAAPTFFNGNADYFLDWIIPRSALVSLGVNASTPLRLVFGSSSSPQRLTSDYASSDNSITLSGLASDNTGGVPELSINAGNPSSIMVTWPIRPLQPSILQFQNVLDTNGWSLVSEPPVRTNLSYTDSHWSCTITNSGTAQFFRLSSQ